MQRKRHLLRIRTNKRLIILFSHKATIDLVRLRSTRLIECLYLMIDSTSVIRSILAATGRSCFYTVPDCINWCFESSPKRVKPSRYHQNLPQRCNSLDSLQLSMLAATARINRPCTNDRPPLTSVEIASHKAAARRLMPFILHSADNGWLIGVSLQHRLCLGKQFVLTCMVPDKFSAGKQ